MELYSESDLHLVRDEYRLMFAEKVESIQAEIDPEDIDPTFWGIAAEAWGQLNPDEQRAVAATRIVDTMRRANIDPDTWHDMPYEDRQAISAAHSVL